MNMLYVVEKVGGERAGRLNHCCREENSCSSRSATQGHSTWQRIYFDGRHNAESKKKIQCSTQPSDREPARERELKNAALNFIWVVPILPRSLAFCCAGKQLISFPRSRLIFERAAHGILCGAHYLIENHRELHFPNSCLRLLWTPELYTNASWVMWRKFVYFGRKP